MNKIKYSDIINYYVKNDYRTRSDILIKLSKHVDKLYDNYIITTDERKKINTLISDTINKLNKQSKQGLSESIFAFAKTLEF